MDMSLPVKQVLQIIRTEQDANKAWGKTLLLCQDTAPSELWDTLPKPNIETDISEATDWLTSQLRMLPEIRGIYLGLDTLNMDGGSGTNIEIGGTTACDVYEDDFEWVYSGLQYGSNHLIYGLYDFHNVYAQPQWKKEYNFSDYILFLAYSGIILGQAFVRITTERILLPVWGFHDGDLFILGRKSLTGFQFICK
jgi:hypothetical protein